MPFTDYEVVFADTEAHIWQDSADHTWIKEIIEEVLERLSIIFKLLPDRYSYGILKFRYRMEGLIDKFNFAILKIRYEMKSLIDKFLIRRS